MSPWRPRSVMFCSALIVACTGFAFGQEAAQTDESREVSLLRKLFDESVNWYELFTEHSPKPMTSRVAMRWANNTRGSETGLTALYLVDGIPEVVCSIYPWEQQICHEFDSLSRSKIVGKKNGVDVWTPATAGIEFRPIPEVDAPGETRTIRLRQMKALSTAFSSTLLGWRSDKTDREPLRLLPQPLYRYEGILSEKRFDGAVFAFVQGTDPETLLLIEAVQQNGSARWEYGFVRQTSGELEGRYRDDVVWHADQLQPSSQSRGVHFTTAAAMPVEVRESLKRKE